MHAALYTRETKFPTEHDRLVQTQAFIASDIISSAQQHSSRSNNVAESH